MEGLLFPINCKSGSVTIAGKAFEGRSIYLLALIYSNTFFNYYCYLFPENHELN